MSLAEFMSETSLFTNSNTMGYCLHQLYYINEKRIFYINWFCVTSTLTSLEWSCSLKQIVSKFSVFNHTFSYSQILWKLLLCILIIIIPVMSLQCHNEADWCNTLPKSDLKLCKMGLLNCIWNFSPF